jgi:hypothetical protein
MEGRIEIERVLPPPPTLPPLHARLASFAALVVTEGVRVSEAKQLLDRALPLPQALAHLSRVRRVAGAAPPGAGAGAGAGALLGVPQHWQLLVCDEAAFLARVAAAASSAAPDAFALAADAACPARLREADCGADAVLRSLSALAGERGGFMRAAVVARANPDREAFRAESENVWPMQWMVPKGGALSPTAIVAAAAAAAAAAAGDTVDGATAAERDYFVRGMRRAARAALAAAAEAAAAAGAERPALDASLLRGCVIVRPPLAFAAATASVDPSLSPSPAPTASGSSPLSACPSPLSDAAERYNDNEGLTGATATTSLPPASATLLAVMGEGGCVLVGSRSDADVLGVNPLMTAAMLAIDGVAARHRVREAAAAARGISPPGLPSKRRRIDEGDGDDVPAGDPGVAHEGEHGNAGAAHEAATSTSSASSASSSSSSSLSAVPAPSMPQYICTGFDAFLTHEPDLFDAMALLHSRVSRVIFGEPDAFCGAVGGPSRGEGLGALRLQEVRELNHHYSVWRVGGVVVPDLDAGLGALAALRKGVA